MAFFRFDESDDTVFFGVDSEVFGHVSSLAGDFSRTGLADENFACFYLLAAKAFDAKALAGIIVNIFGGTASFNVGHSSFSLKLLTLGRQLDPRDDREGRICPIYSVHYTPDSRYRQEYSSENIRHFREAKLGQR